LFFVYVFSPLIYLHSFPTRRSSDLLDTFDLDLKMFVPRYERAHNDYLTVKLEEIDEGSKWKISIGEDDKVKYSMYIEDAKFEYRSEEHTSELQSRENLVCRLLLEKK